MEKKPYNIVGIGELLWDLFPEGKQLGGAPSNVVYHAQILGGRGCTVSAVGNDALGSEIRDKLDGMGLDSSFITVDTDHPTGTVTVELDADGVPDFTIRQNVAWDFIPFSSGLERLAERADAVCFGSLAQRASVSRTTIASFLDLMPKECIKVFDVNLRQSFYSRSIIHASLERANVVKFNEDELPIVANLCDLKGSETDQLIFLMESYGLRLVVLTRGSRGSIIAEPGNYSHLDAPSVDVVDTVGAGDAFTAAVVMGLLRGLPLDRIHRNATMLSASVCTQQGAMPAPSGAVLNELIANDD
jgi:fructokinase